MVGFLVAIAAVSVVAALVVEDGAPTAAMAVSDAGATSTASKHSAPEAASQADAPASSPAKASAAPVIETPTRQGDDSGLARILDHLPADEELLVAFRARQLRQHELLADYFNSFKSDPRWAAMDVVRESCGFDLMDDIDWGVLGSPGDEDFELVLAGNWTRKAVEDCLLRWAVAGEVKREAEVTRLQGTQKGDLVMVWLDDRTFLLSTRQGASKRWLVDRAAGKGKSVRKGKLGRVAQKVDTSASVWVLALGETLASSEDAQEWLPPDAGVDTFAFEISLTDGLSAKGVLSMASVAAARKLESSLQGKIDKLHEEPFAKLLLDELVLESKQREVQVRLGLGPGVTRLLATAVESAFKDQ
jgi:hypothetical protein